MKSFIGEWLEGFHEFHLSRKSADDAFTIRVWDGGAARSFLDIEETRSLYHQASTILTSYLDPDSFSQIYPWHHAAGDFVLKRKSNGVDVRLITVRGYRPLVPVGSDPLDRWIPMAHFFLNMSLRMRLDRLDGTGDLVWASPDCLRGVVSGFLDAWRRKACENEGLPTASDVLEVLGSLTSEEWFSMADLILVDGLVEDEEAEFIQPLLEDHSISLWKAIQRHPKPNSHEE
jgi:hypothetical protein